MLVTPPTKKNRYTKETHQCFCQQILPRLEKINGWLRVFTFFSGPSRFSHLQLEWVFLCPLLPWRSKKKYLGERSNPGLCDLWFFGGLPPWFGVSQPAIQNWWSFCRRDFLRRFFFRVTCPRIFGTWKHVLYTIVFTCFWKKNRIKQLSADFFLEFPNVFLDLKGTFLAWRDLSDL